MGAKRTQQTSFWPLLAELKKKKNRNQSPIVQLINNHSVLIHTDRSEKELGAEIVKDALGFFIKQRC